jgi:hypothetical protein
VDAGIAGYRTIPGILDEMRSEKVTIMNAKFIPVLFTIVLFVGACGENIATESSSTQTDVSAQDLQAIARDAYIYGFPIVMNLKTIYDYTVNTESPNYKGPLNEISCTARLYTPADTAIVTPNSDTPYCMFWMDLRSEPQVLTVPELENDRYYSVQLVDFYTHNYAYIGTRLNDNAAGSYLLAGPDWKGDKPDGITEVLISETDLIFAIIRTQLFDADDLERVAAIQRAYDLQPLSEYAGQEAPTQVPGIDFPQWIEGSEFSVAAFEYLDFALDLVSVHAEESELLTSFAKIGIGTPATFSTDGLEPDISAALEPAVQQGIGEMRAFLELMSSDPLASAKSFGTRAFLNEASIYMDQPNLYLPRATAALVGLYGNSGEEAIYPSYFFDSEGDQPDAAEHNYVIKFAADELPPVKAFWSLSMYDGPTQLFINNSLDRYLVNSAMIGDFTYEEDGSLLIYIQKDPPVGLESNWLPAPDGTFYLVLRLYWPEQKVLGGDWAAPALLKSD